MEKVFRTYYVWPRFPSLSMSGLACSLNCKHCNRLYLRDMIDVSSPHKLKTTCRRLEKEGAVGILLSGGSYKDGEMINLRKFLPYIREIKEETDLIIKLHTGLVDRELAEKIAEIDIDIASLEMVGSNDVIKDVFGMDKTVDDYVHTLQNLVDAGVRHIVPHICIGLNRGKLDGEFHAIDIIKDVFDPEILVFIVLRPTKGTEFENVDTPDPDEVYRVIKYAGEKFRNTEISLGCMRPRSKGRNEIEEAALRAGVTRMEIPSKETIRLAETMGYRIKKIEACCALPREYEDVVEGISSSHFEKPCLSCG